ncbi:hypothetical protein BCR36DRAFT_405744 [Piromyces finnis]|uniref:Uncharacterized protein n=1 Tax=Piromyces finnis TaxID=1754191 RepID=A0A1Y1V4Y6_9FUNG|nr:hypothetical protein BCR36DRAFT_405744 [Piromyces finnis]|eukprot:ORX46146.1 hypothetical protein BCR36DRAFT_405744 [Piromyces finnis]
MDVTGFICKCHYVDLFLKKIIIYRFECYNHIWELKLSLIDETPGRIKVSLKRLSEEPVKNYHNSFVKSKELLNEDNNLIYFSNENVTNKYIPSKCPLGKNTYDKLYNHKKKLEKLFLLSGNMKVKTSESDSATRTTTQIESLVDLYRNDKIKKENNKKDKRHQSSYINNEKKKEEAWTISYFVRGSPNTFNDSDYSFVTLDANNCPSVYFEVDGGICCCNCGGYTYPVLNIIQRTNFNEMKNRLKNLSSSVSTGLFRRIKRSFSSENDLNNNTRMKSKSELMTNWLQKNIYINRHANMDNDNLQVCNYKSNNNGNNYYNYIYTSKIRNPQNNNNKKERDLYKIISFDDNGVDRQKIIIEAMKEYQKDVIRSKRKKEKENYLKKSDKYRMNDNSNNQLSMNHLFPTFGENHYCFCHCHHYQKFDHSYYQKWEHRSIEFGYFGVYIHKNTKMKKSNCNNGKHKTTNTSSLFLSNDYYYSVQIPKYYGNRKKEGSEEEEEEKKEEKSMKENDLKVVTNDDHKKKSSSDNNEEEFDQFLLQDDNDYGDIMIIPCKKYYSLLKKNNLAEITKNSYARVFTENEMEELLHEENLCKQNKDGNAYINLKEKTNSEESLVRVFQECFDETVSPEDIKHLLKSNSDSLSFSSSSSESNSYNQKRASSSELDIEHYGIYKNSSGSLFIQHNDSNEFQYKDYKAIERNRKNNIFYKDFKSIFNIKDNPMKHVHSHHRTHDPNHNYLSSNDSLTQLSSSSSRLCSPSPSQFQFNTRSNSRLEFNPSQSIIDNFNSESDLGEKIKILKLTEDERRESIIASRNRFEESEREKIIMERAVREREIENRRRSQSPIKSNRRRKNSENDSKHHSHRHHHHHHSHHHHIDNDTINHYQDYIYEDESRHCHRSPSPMKSIKSHPSKKSHKNHHHSRKKNTGGGGNKTFRSKHVVKTSDYRYDLANSIYCQ